MDNKKIDEGARQNSLVQSYWQIKYYNLYNSDVIRTEIASINCSSMRNSSNSDHALPIYLLITFESDCSKIYNLYQSSHYPLVLNFIDSNYFN